MMQTVHYSDINSNYEMDPQVVKRCLLFVPGVYIVLILSGTLIALVGIGVLFAIQLLIPAVLSAIAL